VLPTLGVCLVGLFAFVGLAVDLGMLAVNRTQCQNAADAAALVGCRNMDNKVPGNAAYNSNLINAITNSKWAAGGTANAHMADISTTAEVQKFEVGQYAYDPASQTFQVGKWTSATTFQNNLWTDVTNAQTATPVRDSWTALQVTLAVSQPTYFMRVWGVSTMPSGARAVAVHRPRDTAFVLDMTGSMAFGSTFNFNNQSHNPDPLAPVFGHYTSVQNRLVATSNQANGSGEAISMNNYTITTPGGPPIVRDFFFDPANAAAPLTAAFPVTATTSNLKNAFHRWSPPESGGNSDTYTAVTYDFSGYNALHNGTEASPKGPTPAPDNFESMTDTSATGATVPYVGFRWRRANGAVNKVDTTWATGTPTTKGAATAIELLGYTMSGTSVRTSLGATITTSPTEANFRDPTWEQYGYDLDIVKYRTQRADNAPRTAAEHLAANSNLVANILLPAADRFQDFSMGPGYWGKTFYAWPPDPRAANDWRLKFFQNRAGIAFDPQIDNNLTTVGVNNTEGVNEVLLNTGGGLTVSAIGSTGTPNWRINYPAVLAWIKSGPQTLPANLRSGRVLYYSSIPDTVVAGGGNAQQELDKVFWKNYIDYVIGWNYTSAGFLYGSGDSWAASARSVSANDLTAWTGPSTSWPSLKPYMRYNDSPNRPRLHMWFGPLSVMDFLGVQNNWNSGTVHEAQCWQLKASMNSVLDDVQKNHPNDSVGMVMFAYSGYKSIRVAQGQDYVSLKNALFYPKSLLTAIKAGDVTTEVRPFTSAFGSVAQDEIPNANGATDPDTGMAFAFNLLSPSASLPANPYGTVKGRRGASKVVIFETDGVPNSYSSYTLNLRGYDTFYSGFGNGGSPGNGVEPSMSRAVTVAGQIAKTQLTTNAAGQDSGLSLGNAPAKVYPIGFGDLFDPVAAPSATFRPTALQFLANVGIAGGGTVAAGANTIPASQIITGSYQNRIDTLKSCLQNIFQAGVSVTLIE